MVKPVKNYSSKQIFAGKYRRYTGESWYHGLLDIKRLLLNIRDIFLLTIGFFQSFFLLLYKRPSVVFIKGGFVGVPVGLAARFLRIPYITHDSDATAGLTNKIIGKNAKFNAVGMPPENYKYPKNKTVFVGIPVQKEFLDVRNIEQSKLKSKLGLPSGGLTLLIIGGSLGALKIDEIAHDINKKLLDQFPNLNIVHQVGRDNDNLYDDYPKEKRDKIISSRFFKPLSDYMGAADVVITRAGATTLAELASLSKSCVIIPNPYLTGAHQTANAKILSDNNAAIVFDQKTAKQKEDQLINSIADLLKNKAKRQNLGQNLKDLMPSDATHKLAQLILKNN